MRHTAVNEDDGSKNFDPTEIRRTLTTDTQSTDYSSGVHSMDLIMDIYSTITEEEENESLTEFQANHYSKNQEEFFNRVRSMNSWEEEKPFDEESLLAMSEQGIGSKNVLSKGAFGTEEYILPPANNTEKIVGISPYNKEKYLKIKEKPKKVKKSTVKTSTASSGQNNQEEAEEEPKKNEKMICGVSRKFCCIISILALLLLGGATAAGVLTSGMFDDESNESSVSNNQSAATESPDSSTNTDEEPLWGTLITYLEPIPEELFPLGLCAGDCDTNADCAEGLICYQRGENDKVPYCYGGQNDDSSNDYCTYPSDGEMPGDESDECVTKITVNQECFFKKDNVIVLNFRNCDPQDGDWVGLYPSATSFTNETSGIEFVGNDMLNWAFTCGDNDCDDSPFFNRFGFPTDHNGGFGFASLQAYLIRNNVNSPEYEVIAKSEPFEPERICDE